MGAGLLAGYVVLLATGRRLIEATWWQIIPVAAAVIAFGAADALGGSGFVAAFVAGTVFALVAHEDTPTTMRFLEETGALLDAVTFLVFGAVLLGPALEQVSWQVLVFAALSLTVARMVPVAISLWGTHARAPTVTFMGWFGPRGLASIVFAVVVEDAHQIHSTTILTATYLTVGLSDYSRLFQCLHARVLLFRSTDRPPRAPPDPKPRPPHPPAPPLPTLRARQPKAHHSPKGIPAAPLR